MITVIMYISRAFLFPILDNRTRIKIVHPKDIFLNTLLFTTLIERSPRKPLKDPDVYPFPD